MEKWQEKILTQVFHKDFIGDKEIINTAFKELCKPIEEVCDKKSSCKYNGQIDNYGYGGYMLEFEVQYNAYQLQVLENKLLLFFGSKITNYIEDKSIDPICKIEYWLDKNEEIYSVDVLRQRRYKKIIDYDLQNVDLKYEEVREKTDFIFDEDKYKKIINNLMNIATTGLFKGNKIFELKEIVNPFEL